MSKIVFFLTVYALQRVLALCIWTSASCAASQVLNEVHLVLRLSSLRLSIPSSSGWRLPDRLWGLEAGGLCLDLWPPGPGVVSVVSEVVVEVTEFWDGDALLLLWTSSFCWVSSPFLISVFIFTLTQNWSRIQNALQSAFDLGRSRTDLISCLPFLLWL